ncbi:UNVERIFIED_CONTAM: hypothetical protein FKN15_076996 [Acipenser sinensis]
MGGKRLEEASWCLYFTEVRHYQRESAPQRPPLLHDVTTRHRCHTWCPAWDHQRHLDAGRRGGGRKMGGKRLEEASWCLYFTEVRHYQRESAPQRPPLQRRMERYESWLRDPSTPLWLKTGGRHLLGDSNLDILLDFVRLEPDIQEKAITRGYPGLIEALERMTQMVDWVYQE